MKLVNLVCPECGAQLDVDMATGQARCRFCKEIYQINDNAQDEPMNGAEQMGYDFERGRQRANVEFTQGFADRMAEARQHMPAPDPAPAYVPEPTYYEPPAAPAQSQGLPIWLLVVLWLVFPPLGIAATVFTLISTGRILRVFSSIFSFLFMMLLLAMFFSIF